MTAILYKLVSLTLILCFVSSASGISSSDSGQTIEPVVSDESGSSQESSLLTKSTATTAADSTANTNEKEGVKGEDPWWLKDVPSFLPPPPEWGPLPPQLYTSFYHRPVGIHPLMRTSRPMLSDASDEYSMKNLMLGSTLVGPVVPGAPNTDAAAVRTMLRGAPTAQGLMPQFLSVQEMLHRYPTAFVTTSAASTKQSASSDSGSMEGSLPDIFPHKNAIDISEFVTRHGGENNPATDDKNEDGNDLYHPFIQDDGVLHAPGKYAAPKPVVAHDPFHKLKKGQYNPRISEPASLLSDEDEEEE